MKSRIYYTILYYSYTMVNYTSGGCLPSLALVAGAEAGEGVEPSLARAARQQVALVVVGQRVLCEGARFFLSFVDLGYSFDWVLRCCAVHRTGRSFWGVFVRYRDAHLPLPRCRSGL